MISLHMNTSPGVVYIGCVLPESAQLASLQVSSKPTEQVWTRCCWHQGRYQGPFVRLKGPAPPGTASVCQGHPHLVPSPPPV